MLQITDIASYKLPDETVNFCLLILGSSVGCRFAEKTIKEIANNSLHSIVATTILVALGLFAAYVATFFVDTNILNVQKKLEETLGLRVYISNKKNNSGKITIVYKDLEQFELVSDLLTKN